MDVAGVGVSVRAGGESSVRLKKLFNLKPIDELTPG